MSSLYRPTALFRRWEIFLFLVLIVGAIGFAIVSETRKSWVESDCRKHGYPEAKINWGGLGAAYCVKRVDQTDVVVPAGDLP